MFEASYPVSGRGFFDRGAELKRLCHAVGRLRSGSPKWLMLIGPRKVGKTSLLTELARRIGPVPPIAVVDVQRAAPLSKEFFRTYAVRVVDRLWSAKCGVSLEALADDPDAFRDALLESEPYAQLGAPLRRQLATLPDAECDATFVRTALAMPEELATRLELEVVVAIDEFQELAQLRDKRRSGFDPFPVMRSIWQQHRRTSYIVSGSSRSMLLDLTTDAHAPFYQHFDVMELDTFSHADACAMFSELSRPFVLPPDKLSKIVDTLACHPFYLQLFGEVLLELCETTEASRADLHTPECGADVAVAVAASKPALQRVLFSRTGRLALYFSRLYDRAVGRSSTQAAVLNVLCEGPATLSAVARQIRATPGSASHYIERLGDIVETREDGQYAICDPAFALWLRWRKPGGTVVPMRTLGDEAELHVASHLARNGFDLVYQSRGSRGSFDLLATRGPAMVGVQVKRAKLPYSVAPAEVGGMRADAQRLGWKAAFAIVDSETKTLFFFDVDRIGAPKGQRGRSESASGRGGEGGSGSRRLKADAAIDNLLLWCQEP